MVERPNNDMVDDRWKPLFNNEEWLAHGIVVRATYGFLAIAVVAHILVLIWNPWLQGPG